MSHSRRIAIFIAALVLMPFGLVFAIAVSAAASGTASPQAAHVVSCGGTSTNAGNVSSLSTAQITDAKIIYGVAVSMQIPPPGAVIAIATAMQESRLLNVGAGSADSLGLFQQRPSQGWGSPSQIMQPAYAAAAFYTRLLQVPGWQNLPLTVAAQDVQRSAFPGAYAKWQPLAAALVGQFAGTTVACVGSDGRGLPASGTTRLPERFSLPPGTSAAVRIAIAYALAELGKPYLWGGTGPSGYDCSGLVMMAYRAAGISLPRTTFQQVNSGTPVYGLSQLMPGDLLFAPGSDGTADNPGHVGMYLGSGQVIEAPQTGKPVMITPLAGYWQRQTTAIRRVV